MTDSFRRLGSSLAPSSHASYLGYGALSALGRPGIDLPLCFIAMMGVLMVGAITATSTRAASVRALLFGVGAALPIAIGAQSWGWVVPAGMVIVGAGCYVLPLGLLTRWTYLRVSPRYGVLFVGIVWSLYGSLAGAFDVPLAGMSQALAPSAAWALGGVRCVGTAILEGAFVATVFATAAAVARSRGCAVRARIGSAARPLIAGLSGVLALSSFARLSAPHSEGEVRVGVVQVNAGPEYHGARLEIPAMQRAFDRQLESLLDQVTDVELVVMPETFDGRYTLMLPDRREAWSARAKERHQAYLVTSYLSEGSGLKSNAAGLIDARGTLTGIHRKVVLAPYGERGLVAGSVYRTLPLDDRAAVGVTICQESMSGMATRRLTEAGAALLIGTSSDISFGSSLVPFEHLAATRLRAIESGRSIVWASNAGPSGVIDRWGVSPALGPFRQAVAVKTTAELQRDTTPYFTLRPHWLALLVLALVALGWLMRRDIRSGPDRVSGESGSRRWQPALLSAGLLGGVLVGMPAMVELRHGSTPRALVAIADLWTAEARVPLRGDLQRFYTAPEQSYAGALALFSSYYGQELGREGVPAPVQPGLLGLHQLLRERYRIETHVIRLGELMPQTAALVELSDDSFGVLASPTGQAGWLVAPGRRSIAPINSDIEAALAGRPALVPTGLGRPR